MLIDNQWKFTIEWYVVVVIVAVVVVVYVVVVAAEFGAVMIVIFELILMSWFEMNLFVTPKIWAKIDKMMNW